MAEIYLSTEAMHEEPHNSLSIPVVVGAAVLMGVGLFLVLAWVIDQAHWIFFLGTLVAAVGFLLVFTQLTGSDRSG
ncbi:MAG: hypothetical protein L3K03_04595 [Thermoplasmata archaeon]|nr:hypothetical protein [Thermoplasmata archaeon]